MIFIILKIVDSESARFSQAAVVPFDVCPPGGRVRVLPCACVATDPLPLGASWGAPAGWWGHTQCPPALANSPAARLPAGPAAAMSLHRTGIGLGSEESFHTYCQIFRLGSHLHRAELSTVFLGFYVRRRLCK